MVMSPFASLNWTGTMVRVGVVGVVCPGAGSPLARQNRMAGRAVGARQVIYVNLVKFSTAAPIGSSELAGGAEALVRVIDVNTGHTLWPQDNSAGREIKYETKHEEAVDFTRQSEVQDQISALLADHIARLFYAAPEPEHEVGPKR